MKSWWLIFIPLFAGAAPLAQGVIAGATGSVAARGQTAVDGRIDSAILHESRPLHIILPSTYGVTARDRTYPVIVIFDGEDSAAPAAATVGELSHNGQIPEAIVVTIPNTNRLRDLTPPGLSVSGSSLHEGGDTFLDFIEHELLPAIDRQYRGGGPRVLVGHSSGGILATYAAATRTTFSAVVAIDTPTALGEGWLVKRLMARERQSEPGALRYASYESRFGWDDDSWRTLVAAAPAAWQLHRERLVDESHETMPMLGMYLGLREVFRDYSALRAPITEPGRVLPYYAAIGAELAADLIPPRDVLSKLVTAALDRGSVADARAAFALLTRGYGPPADAAAIDSRIAALATGEVPAQTVDSLLATPFPSVEEAAPYLGEWSGVIWMGADKPNTRPVRLRIRVENGRVVGDTVRQASDGREDVQAWQYMRVTPIGLTFGRLNGMEPRGVAMFEGRLQENRLSGEVHIRGVTLDSGAPTLHFEFTRVR